MAFSLTGHWSREKIWEVNQSDRGLRNMSATTMNFAKRFHAPRTFRIQWHKLSNDQLFLLNLMLYDYNQNCGAIT